MMSAFRDRAPVGVITGMQLEAATLETTARDGESDWIRVCCSGASPDRTVFLANRLMDQGCRALLSYGLAGGLEPALRPGTLLLPAQILDPAGLRHDIDSDWRSDILAALTAAGLPCVESRLAGCDAVIDHPRRKQELAKETGAGAVDMESHRIAAVAAERGVPFLVLRAVGDPAERTLPRSALAAIQPDGGTNKMAVATALLRRPWELADLIRLGRDSESGLAALGRAVHVLSAPTLFGRT